MYIEGIKGHTTNKQGANVRRTKEVLGPIHANICKIIPSVLLEWLMVCSPVQEQFLSLWLPLSIKVVI